MLKVIKGSNKDEKKRRMMDWVFENLWPLQKDTTTAESKQEYNKKDRNENFLAKMVLKISTDEQKPIWEVLTV